MHIVAYCNKQRPPVRYLLLSLQCKIVLRTSQCPNMNRRFKSKVVLPTSSYPTINHITLTILLVELFFTTAEYTTINKFHMSIVALPTSMCLVTQKHLQIQLLYHH